MDNTELTFPKTFIIKGPAQALVAFYDRCKEHGLTDFTVDPGEHTEAAQFLEIKNAEDMLLAKLLGESVQWAGPPDFEFA